jgi:hypothetical protein
MKENIYFKFDTAYYKSWANNKKDKVKLAGYKRTRIKIAVKNMIDKE